MRSGLRLKGRTVYVKKGLGVMVQIVLNDLKLSTRQAKNAMLMVMIQLGSQTAVGLTYGNS